MVEDKEHIDNSFEIIVYHIHAILNSFDDLIDESPQTMRKSITMKAVLIVSSFFILFKNILKNLVKPSFNVFKAIDHFFNESNTMIKDLTNAAHEALNPPILDSIQSISEIGEISGSIAL